MYGESHEQKKNEGETKSVVCGMKDKKKKEKSHRRTSIGKKNRKKRREEGSAGDRLKKERQLDKNL